jgi:acyl-CoA oxidase
MLQSVHFKENPKLYIFLPLYHILWEDRVLSPTEMIQMQSLIQKQKWLSEAERNWLVSKIDPRQPPGAKELRSWKAKIKKLDLGQYKTIYEIGETLAKQQDPDLIFERN